MIALVGEPGGWRAGAASDEEAIDITHGNPPRAREGWCGERLIRNERYCRDRRLAGERVGVEFPRLASHGVESAQDPAG